MKLNKILLDGMVALSVPMYCVGAADCGAATQEELNAGLYAAAQIGDNAAVQRLLDQKADVNAKITGKVVNQTEYVAAMKGYVTTRPIIQARRAFINKRVNFDKTALQVAAGAGHAKTVGLLLTNSASIDAEDLVKVMSMAEYGKKEKTVRLLIDAYYIGLSARCPRIANREGQTQSMLPGEIWELITTDFSLSEIATLRQVNKNFCVGISLSFEKVRKKRACQLKKELIGFIGSTLERINSCLFFETMPAKKLTIEFLKIELEQAEKLEQEGLLTGDIICDGNLRSFSQLTDSDLNLEVVTM